MSSNRNTTHWKENYNKSTRKEFSNRHLSIQKFLKQIRGGTKTLLSLRTCFKDLTPTNLKINQIISSLKVTIVKKIVANRNNKLKLFLFIRKSLTSYLPPIKSIVPKNQFILRMRMINW